MKLLVYPRDPEATELLLRLYRRDPVTHAYLGYDVVEMVENTRVYALVEGDEVKGYVLVWRAGDACGIHVWGSTEGLENKVVEEVRDKCIVQTYDNDTAVMLRELLEAEGYEVKPKIFIDMVADEESFKPWLAYPVERLSPNNKRHVEAIAKLFNLDVEKAKAFLERLRHHGVFLDNELVAVAGTCVRMPRVWVICGVYTKPEHRGKGLAKTTTSSVTREAISIGALAYLHVEKGNEPAIRAYKRIGYKPIRERTWLFCKKTR